MRPKLLGSAGSLLLLALCFFAFRSQKTLDLFILRDVEAPEAFRVEIALGPGKIHLEPVALALDQRGAAKALLKDRDAERLSGFARGLGSFHAVVGLPETEGAWPSFWENGPKARAADGEFDDMTWMDRSFLWMGPHPASPPPGEAPVAVKAETPTIKNPPTPVVGVPSPLLVEIQNGCGITGAAEWVSRRLKGTHVKIVAMGNADHFRYPKTLLRTPISVSPALEEVLDRLEVDPSQVEGHASPVPGVDVVIVIGRDFPKLKEKWRERDRHGTQ